MHYLYQAQIYYRRCKLRLSSLACLVLFVLTLIRYNTRKIGLNLNAPIFVDEALTKFHEIKDSAASEAVLRARAN